MQDQLIVLVFTDGNPGAHSRMQTDGNLVVYTAAGRALWSSKYGRTY